MPELPEAETIVRDLNKTIIGRRFTDVWFDWLKTIKKPKNTEQFKKEIRNKKVKKIWRRGKNILFDLSGDKTLLIHQKMTGHLLVGYWILDDGYWKPKEKGPLEDPMNRFIHLVFRLDDGRQLALSDLRKFAKVELWDSEELKNSQGLQELGPEPLEKSFTFEKFKECLKSKKGLPARRHGKIKQVLMNQNIIVGIGNIYADEILFEAKIHPQKDVAKLSEASLKRIYRAIKKVLKKAIKLRGTSISDFRDIKGQKGAFGKVRKVYRREGEKCFHCKTKIQRLKIGGRSAHFCPNCQKP